jgi:hypothetical protein
MNASRAHASLTRMGAALAMLLAAASTAEAQTPTRPLILIGGTFVHKEFAGTGGSTKSGWPEIIDWLELRGGYTEGENLFVIEMCKDTSGDPYDFWKCSLRSPEPPNLPYPAPQPPGWTNPLGIQWSTVINEIEAAGGSTAGLASMSKSVEHVIMQINLLRLFQLGGQRVDIVAHSQSGLIARAAVRTMKEQAPSEPSPVVRLISLGTPQYGGSTGTPVLDRAWGGFLGAVWSLVAENFLGQCRDGGLGVPTTPWIPICADMFLTFPSEDGRIRSEVPRVTPNPLSYYGRTDQSAIVTYRPFTYRSGFLPGVNSQAGMGPLAPDTDYYNLYSRDHDGGGVSVGEEHVMEQLRLFPAAPNVRNWNIQDLVACQGGPANYALHHVDEWVDAWSREAILAALGHPSFAVPTCLEQIDY